MLDSLLESNDCQLDWKRLGAAVALSLVIHISLAGSMYQLFADSVSVPGSSSLSIDIVSTHYSDVAEAPIIQPVVPQPVVNNPVVNNPPPVHKPVQKKMPAKAKTIKIITAKQVPDAVTTNEAESSSAELEEELASETVLASLPQVATIKQTSVSSAEVKPSRRESSIHPVFSPQPTYPRPARRLGLEGRVLLGVWVTAEGVPDVIVVKQSSGHDSLDESAKAGVQQWRFDVPDDAVDRWLELPVTFRLE